MVDGYSALVPLKTVCIEALFSIHYFEYANNFSYTGEKHNFWEFCYIDKGELTVFDGETRYELKKTQIIFHKPNVFHRLQANGTVAPNLVVVSFSCNSPLIEWFGGRILEVNNEERVLLSHMISEASDAFLSPLNEPELKSMQRNTKQSTGSEQLIKIFLEAFIISMYRKYHVLRRAKKETQKTIWIQNQHRQVDEVLNYFEKNISSRLTVEDICRDNHIGRNHLQMLFRERIGYGAIECFGRMKIEAAKQMIREGHNNFTEISDFLGYTTIHYFSRRFKMLTGMSPSEYATSIKAIGN